MAIVDGTGKCRVHWFTDENGNKKWKCLSRLSSPEFKGERDSCWYHPCPGRSMVGYPYTKEEITQKRDKELTEKIESSVALCNNYSCNNTVSSNRKLYCSDKCRKQKARIDYEFRNPNRQR
jgi:hypothetical protein